MQKHTSDNKENSKERKKRQKYNLEKNCKIERSQPKKIFKQNNKKILNYQIKSKSRTCTCNRCYT